MAEARPVPGWLLVAPSLTDAERQVLAEIGRQKELLAYALGATPRRWQAVLRRLAFARSIRDAANLEGVEASPDEALAVVDGERPLHGLESTYWALEGHKSALLYVYQVADDPHFSYSPELLRSLHFIILQRTPERNAGRWRPGPIYVWDRETHAVTYEAPEASAVPALVANLMVELAAAERSNQPALLTAAMAHLRVFMIQPFTECNARIAECLEALVLARTRQVARAFASVDEYMGSDPRGYHEVLAQVCSGFWTDGANVRPWIRYCLRAYHYQVMALLRRARELDRLWTRLETAKPGQPQFPERLIQALLEAALGHSLWNARYRAVSRVTDQVASRDFNMAVRAGFLEPRDEARSRYYVASRRLQELWRHLREPRGVPDPFEAVEDEPPWLPGLEGV